MRYSPAFSMPHLMLLIPFLALPLTGLSSSAATHQASGAPPADTATQPWSANAAAQEPAAAPRRLVRRVSTEGGVGHPRQRDENAEPDAPPLQRQRTDQQDNFVAVPSVQNVQHFYHPYPQQTLTQNTFPQQPLLQHQYLQAPLQPQPLQHFEHQHYEIQPHFPQYHFPQLPLPPHYEAPRYEPQHQPLHFPFPPRFGHQHESQHREPQPQRPLTRDASSQTPGPALRRVPMQDASTQTPGPGTGVEDLLRLDTLGRLHTMPALVQREVMKRVYPAKLAQVFWEANQQQLHDEEGLEWQRREWRRRHWEQNEALLAPLAQRARDRFLRDTRRDMQTIVHDILGAREARPESLRKRRPLARNADLQARLQPHEDRIRAAAEQGLRTALLELADVHRDDPGFPGHVQQYMRTPTWHDLQQRFNSEVTRKFNGLWSEPTGMPWFANDWAHWMFSEVQFHVTRLLDTRRDLPAQLRQRLYDGAVPLVAAVEHGPAAGIARIRAHPGSTVLATGANWIAWTYARMFYEHTCGRMGLLPHVLRHEFRSNLEIIPPPVPELARQRAPPQMLLDRGVQTTET